MQLNKKATAKGGWHPCNYIVLKHRDVIFTKRPVEHGMNHTLNKNRHNNTICSKISDEDTWNSKIDNNYKEFKTKEPSLWFDEHDLMKNDESTWKDAKVKTDKMLNISQGHTQKFLTKTFECNVNIKTTHYQEKD